MNPRKLPVLIKNIYLPLLLFISLSLKGQEKQAYKPIFDFQAKVKNDSVIAFFINTVIEKGEAILPVSKDSSATFSSQITFDSSIKLGTPSILAVYVKGTMVQSEFSGEKLTSYKDTVRIEILVASRDTSKILSGTFNWLLYDGISFPTGAQAFSVSVERVPDTIKTNTENENGMDKLGGIFLLTFLTGLLAVFTPCVFPIIPVTVSFFLKKNNDKKEGIKNALFYSFSIILIYTVPTLLLTFLFGNTALYNLSTSPFSNLLFFGIFITFATSFFGAFDINLPNSWANKADSNVGKGGLAGTFFMALTLVIVSFSCTGPLVGTLLSQTSMGGVAVAPIVGMLGFGVGLALPFSLFAFFPAMLKSLPKSGGWLNSVKVAFGFIELALALKFLSNVDLIYHWHLLDRDVFLSLWIVIFFMLGLYLLGKLNFSHDSPLAYITIPRLFFSIASWSFTVYLLPGLWGAPLQPLSGFIPPSSTQGFNLENLFYYKQPTAQSNQHDRQAASPPLKYTDKLHVPFGLTAYFDLEEGKAASKILHKPILLDFTGHSCANCRKMEEQVWKNKEVLQRLKDDFVIVSLFVDESTRLAENEIRKDKEGNNITTVGEKNIRYEIEKFGFNAQPLYMFIDENENILSEVKYGYDPDLEKFSSHLDRIKQIYLQKK